MRRLAAAIAAATFLAACTSATPATRSQDVASAKPTASVAASAASSPAAGASTQPMEVVGKFALDPAHGAWDTKVSATATGMKANTKYDLVWVTGKVTWKLSDDKSKYLGKKLREVDGPNGRARKFPACHQRGGDHRSPASAAYRVTEAACQAEQADARDQQAAEDEGVDRNALGVVPGGVERGVGGARCERCNRVCAATDRRRATTARSARAAPST